MKETLIIFCLLIFSCSSNDNGAKADGLPEIQVKFENDEKKVIKKPNPTFEETQDSLRKILLASLPNENLKSSILQEFYIRRLVNQINEEIIFKLPFDLHGNDCGAPDCYSTDISFAIKTSEPVKFPKKIDFELFEHGCVDHEILMSGEFVLHEKTSVYVNYFSKDLKSNLILKKNGELYYFPHLSSKSISVETLDEMFNNNEFEGAKLAPFQSTIMNAKDYGNFIKTE